MIVTAWGGPHDGRSIELPDGTKEIRFAVMATIDWRELVASGEFPPPPKSDVVYEVVMTPSGSWVVVNPPHWLGR